MRKTIFFSLIWVLILLVSACQSEERVTISPATDKDTSTIDQSTSDTNDSNNKIQLTTSEETWEFADGITDKVWTYGGTVPGKQLRIQEGELLTVELVNDIDVPVTIHWHGMVLPNPMDGVPGITQEPVQPGDTFTYQFKAEQPGTYWYHSHQQSSEQVDRGLYGALIVKPREKSYDEDAIFILDEWLLPRKDDDASRTNNEGALMDDSTGDMDTQMLYNTFTVNGKRYPDVTPAKFKSGQRMRLRFINAGYQKHILSLGKQDYQIVALDGQPVRENKQVDTLLEIAPGERIDIEMTPKDDKDILIQSVDNDFAAVDMKIPLQIDELDDSNKQSDHVQSVLMDQTTLQARNPLFPEDVKVDKEYDLLLGAAMHMGQGVDFTINGETYPETPSLHISEGETVKVTLTNDSEFDHPMHLHGHHFQIVSKNGKQLNDPIVKDLINVKPDETYEIIFEADNPGNWVFHCHDLLHAESGMMSVINYKNYTSPVDIHK